MHVVQVRMVDPSPPTNTATPLDTNIPLPPPDCSAPSLGSSARPLQESVAIARTPVAAQGRTPAPKASTGKRPASSNGENKSCNCRNSKCLKLYCECFASGRYCSGCNCANCMNNTMHEAARSRAIEAILERNPNAFRPKIQFQPVRSSVQQAYRGLHCALVWIAEPLPPCSVSFWGALYTVPPVRAVLRVLQGQDGASAQRVTRHSKGCSCRKSHCLKKYCECFQAGIFCGNTCRCKDCRNYDGSTALASVMDVADAARSSHAVRPAARSCSDSPMLLFAAPRQGGIVSCWTR